MINKPSGRLIVAFGVLAALAGSALVVADRAGTARPGSGILAAAAANALAGHAAQASAEIAAADFAAAIRGVPTRDGDFDDLSRYCQANRLRVTWSPPASGYRYGAYIEPLGPAPTAGTAAVNGIVSCDGSTYAYMGFEAIRSGGGWEIIPVPDVQDDDRPDAVEAPGDKVDPGLVGRATPPASNDVTTNRAPLPSPAAGKLTAAIEAYSGYDSQDTCSATAKPGVLAFRSLVLAKNPATRSMGITRACSAGGRSEHKEGRAWDWGARMDRPGERASAQALINWLFATDEFGNTHAMARRLGVMYIVWNRQIWGAYRAGEGWRSYNGTNPHTDHVHFSFAWPGAQGTTSFWTGVPAAMPGGTSGRSGGSSGGGNGSMRQAGGGHPLRDRINTDRPRDTGDRWWWRGGSTNGTKPDAGTWTWPTREHDPDGDRWGDGDRWRRDPTPTPSASPSTSPEPSNTHSDPDATPAPTADPATTPAPASGSGHMRPTSGTTTEASWRDGDRRRERRKRRGRKRTRRTRQTRRTPRPFPSGTSTPTARPA